MKRREFLKKGSVAVGLAGSLDLLPSLVAGESIPEAIRTNGRETTVPPTIFAARRRTSSCPSRRWSRHPPDAVTISPMPLAERVRRKIVPRRGFCSLSPGSGALLSGTGAVNIELEGDPYTEQIPFRHEMLYVPRRRPAEAPNIAEILPQVRQMMLDGKYPRCRAIRLPEISRQPHPGRRNGAAAGRRIFHAA